jgi:hypothetical protein
MLNRIISRALLASASLLLLGAAPKDQPPQPELQPPPDFGPPPRPDRPPPPGAQLPPVMPQQSRQQPLSVTRIMSQWEKNCRAQRNCPIDADAPCPPCWPPR